MNIHPLNVLDGLIIITIGWNFLRGFNKGFVEEILSLVGIFASIAVAFYFSPLLAKQLLHLEDSSSVVVTGVALYFISFLIFKYVALLLNSKLAKTSLGFLNNVLGLLFGIFRGYAISAIIVLGVALLAPESYLIKKSYLGGIAVPLIDRVLPLIPEKAREDIEGNWQTARNYLWGNLKKWKEKGGEQEATPPERP